MLAFDSTECSAANRIEIETSFKQIQTTSNQDVPRVVVFKVIICVLEQRFCACIQLYHFSPMKFFSNCPTQRGQFAHQNSAIKTIGHNAC